VFQLRALTLSSYCIRPCSRCIHSMHTQGFICVDHMADELEAAKNDLAELVKAGKIKYTEDVREGLESYPATVRLLMSGGNTGKLLLKI